jgi:hypothetical protein
MSISLPTVLGSLASGVASAAGPYTYRVPVPGLVALSPAALSVSPSSLSFPATNVGKASSEQKVNIANTGEGQLNVTNVSTGASSFSVSSNTCGTVPGGGSCSIGVVFTPGAVGTISGTLTVQTTAGTQSVALGGTGQNPEMAASLDPGAVAAVTYSGTGPWGVNPFGTWVWNSPNFSSSAGNSPIVMESLVNNSSGSPVSVYVDVSVDNIVTGVKLNGTLLPGSTTVSGWSPPKALGPVSLPPGTSLLKVQAANQGGPAGLQVRVRTTSGQVLNTTAANPWFSSAAPF